MRCVREKSMADAAALAALTGLDPEEAANLLDATGGDFEMAVSLHYGDQADADLYWSDDEDVAGKLLEAELERSSKEKATHVINRLEARQRVEHRNDAGDRKKRERKSRAAVRSEEAEALLMQNELASGKATASGFSCLAIEGSDDGSNLDSDEESTSDDSSSEEWVDDEWSDLCSLRRGLLLAFCLLNQGLRKSSHPMMHGRVPRTNECLFDGHESATFEENCAYMQAAHSFFVPFLKYLVDAEGLFAYLQEKIYSYNTCIYCNRAFGDLDAVRKHMKDKSHCKVNFEDDDGVTSTFMAQSRTHTHM